jgi:hypothetical protein
MYKIACNTISFLSVVQKLCALATLDGLQCNQLLGFTFTLCVFVHESGNWRAADLSPKCTKSHIKFHKFSGGNTGGLALVLCQKKKMHQIAVKLMYGHLGS